MRLRVLELPMTSVGEVCETPFLLVLDKAADMADGPLAALTWDAVAQRCGARTVLITADEVEFE
jgi:hypothetical protein